MDKNAVDGSIRRTRRQFVAGLSRVAAAAFVPALGATDDLRRLGRSAFRVGESKAQSAGIPVVIQARPDQGLDYDRIARMALEMGMDGVDMTVRPLGPVLPDNVEDELPRAVEAIHRVGLRVPIITTAITDADDPLSERVLKTASELGIRQYRIGNWLYDLERPIPPQIESFRAKAEGLAIMNRHYGMCGDYQNHGGAKHVGASVWDLWEIIKDIDPNLIGCQFDTRHAVVDGATAWSVSFKLLAPRIHSVIPKDFTWRQRGDGWVADNAQVGTGAVDFDAFFGMLKAAEFNGTVILHNEFQPRVASAGETGTDTLEKLFIERGRAEAAQVRTWLKSYGITS